MPACQHSWLCLHEAHSHFNSDSTAPKPQNLPIEQAVGRACLTHTCSAYLLPAASPRRAHSPAPPSNLHRGRRTGLRAGATSQSVTMQLTANPFTHVPVQANLVAILAASLPPGSTVEMTLLTGCFLPYLNMHGALGNVHKARAREAVLGALSRGLQVRLEDGSRREVQVDSPELLAQMLQECCASPLRSMAVSPLWMSSLCLCLSLRLS
jgi:hypothetical protein